MEDAANGETNKLRGYGQIYSETQHVNISGLGYSIELAEFLALIDPGA